MDFRMSKVKTVCIIGAGISGLTSIKACLEENLEPICYELTGDLGGLWRYTDYIEPKASVMKTTVINTSKEVMAFSDYPPDDKMPNFMSHEKVLLYIRGYVDNYDLGKHIRYHTEVLAVSFIDEKWLVKTKHDGKETEQLFDAVMVCTGHHSIPYKPHFEGLESYKGKVWHTHDVRDPLSPEFHDKRCLIIGIGNSALDTAMEISSVAKIVYLSTRSGAWIKHRIGENGLPLDLTLSRFVLFIGGLLGFHLLNKILMKRFNAWFDHAKYALQPKFMPLQQHGAVCDSLPTKILSGKVVIKSNVKLFSSNDDYSASGSVEFEDGSVEHDIAHVIMGTGYCIDFPFLDSSVIEPVDNRLSLYKHVFPTHMGKNPSIAFIGYVQPLGATLPLSELQARWAVRVFKNINELPKQEKMIKSVDADRAEMARRYKTSMRYTIQVDYLPYADSIASEIGCKPSLMKLLISDPQLALRVFIGPITSYQYRLFGCHQWSPARETIMNQWQRVLQPLQTRPVEVENSTVSTIVSYMTLLFVCLSSYKLYHLYKN